MDVAHHGRRRVKVEFGDFQTPPRLAARICQQLARTGLRPSTILEPTCGCGNLLVAASTAFPQAHCVAGIDVNPDHLQQLDRTLADRPDRHRFRLRCENIFELDGKAFLSQLPEPWLVIGNPPWVTSSVLGALHSRNVPAKSNVDGRRGIDAITGQANFDVSEWILRAVMTWLDGHQATLAMLCKTSVARKLLAFSWQNGSRMQRAAIHVIDAAAEFEAAVHACLLVCDFQSHTAVCQADIYPSLESSIPSTRMGWRKRMLIADIDRFDRWQHLQSDMTWGTFPTCQSKSRDGKVRATRCGPNHIWRSGIKHDCASVLELTERDGQFHNRLGELLEIEGAYLYPLLKSSDLAGEAAKEPRHWLIVPQRISGDDTAQLAITAPRLWRYLVAHADWLDRRRSSIYKRRPRFSVFGVGPYSFAPWKVAISGFYKRLQFTAVNSVQGRPIMLDDTCYFLPCDTQHEALRLTAALNSAAAREFFSAFIFWDAKRPITAEILRRLDIEKLIAELNGNLLPRSKGSCNR